MARAYSDRSVLVVLLVVGMAYDENYSVHRRSHHGDATQREEGITPVGVRRSHQRTGIQPHGSRRGRKQRLKGQRHRLKLDKILNEISSNQNGYFDERTEQSLNASEIGRFGLPKRIEHPVLKASDRLSLLLDDCFHRL